MEKQPPSHYVFRFLPRTMYFAPTADPPWSLSLLETGPRADSVHLVEKLCSFYHLDIHRHSRERAGMGDRGGSSVGAKYIVRGRKDTTQTVLNIERAQGCCPWSPPQEGARGQSSSARRGLPSKGEARALHHQPAPASTLTTPCSLLSIAARNGETP